VGERPAIEVSNLRIELSSSGTDIVDDISLSIVPGQVLGLVGESGSGKTTVGLALLGHQRRGARISAGRIRIGELDMLALPGRQLRAARGRDISYVPQDPAASLNPARRIGVQLLETLKIHEWGSDDAARRARVLEVLGEVSLPQDESFLRRYPHELSGGQQQRVAIARALVNQPVLMLLDEVTSALDPELVGEVLNLLRDLKAEGMTMLIATHEMGFARQVADTVCFLDGGQLLETGPPEQVLGDPTKERTRQFLSRIIDAGRL
jgi:peptide/nickel transport system ATP-binding protein